MHLSNAQLAILSLIVEHPRYGYQIEQTIEERGMREWTEIGFSSIYYLLNKLQDQGLLLSQVETQADRPNRRVYEITEVGRTIFHEAVRECLAQPRPHSGDFDLGLANLPALTPQEALTALQDRRAALVKRVDKVRLKWEYDRQHGAPPHIDALFDHSLARLQTELEWVERWIHRFSQEGVFAWKPSQTNL